MLCSKYILEVLSSTLLKSGYSVFFLLILVFIMSQKGLIATIKKHRDFKVLLDALLLIPPL